MKKLPKLNYKNKKLFISRGSHKIIKKILKRKKKEMDLI